MQSTITFSISILTFSQLDMEADDFFCREQPMLHEPNVFLYQGFKIIVTTFWRWFRTILHLWPRAMKGKRKEKKRYLVVIFGSPKTMTMEVPWGGALHCQVEHHVRYKKNLLFLSCITKMDQNFINFFSWVDIHDIYYILKIHNQIWWSCFFNKTYHF